MSSTQIQWDSNGLSEAYQQVSSLRSTLQTQKDAYREYRGQLKSAVNYIDDSTDSRIGVSSREGRLKKQDEQMQSLRSLVSLAMDNADEVNNSLASDLDRFKLTIGAMLLGGSSMEAIGYTALAAGAAAIGAVFGLMRGIPFANLGKIVEQVRKKAEGTDGADSTTTAAADPEVIQQDVAGRSANIINETNSPNVRANKYLSDGKINCVWLARQKMCDILGDDTLFSDKLGTAKVNWKNYQETGIDGYSVDYREVSSGTSMSDAVKALANDQPCTAMFYMNGHTFTVDRIENGMVYWTDNFTTNSTTDTSSRITIDGNKYPGSVTGASTCATLEGFAKWYDNYAPSLQSYVVLKKQ